MSILRQVHSCVEVWKEQSALGPPDWMHYLKCMYNVRNAKTNLLRDAVWSETPRTVLVRIKELESIVRTPAAAPHDDLTSCTDAQRGWVTQQDRLLPACRSIQFQRRVSLSAFSPLWIQVRSPRLCSTELNSLHRYWRCSGCAILTAVDGRAQKRRMARRYSRYWYRRDRKTRTSPVAGARSVNACGVGV